MSLKIDRKNAARKNRQNLLRAAARQKALDKATSNMNPEKKAKYVAAARRTPEAQQFRKQYKKDRDNWVKLGRPQMDGSVRTPTMQQEEDEKAREALRNYRSIQKIEGKRETRKVLSELDRLGPTKKELADFSSFLDSDDKDDKKPLSDKTLKQIKRKKIPAPPKNKKNKKR